MNDFSKYIDKDEHILSKESNANFLTKQFNVFSFIIFISLIICLCLAAYTNKGSIYETISNILILPLFIFIFYAIVARFFTKVILTDRRIIVIQYRKPVFYNYKDIASYKTEIYSGWLTLKLKNKILPILSRTDGKVFNDKFLEVYPDFIEEKQKANPIFTTLMVLYAICCFFCIHQIKTTEYIKAKEVRTEYLHVIREQKNHEYFEQIFKKILLNIEYQKSKEPLKVIVDFYVNDTSNIEKYNIAKISSNDAFNKSVINALEKAFPLEQEMPESLKTYQPVRMRLNVLHKGTDDKFLIKNYDFWFEIYGPEFVKPYQKFVFNHKH